MSPFKAPPKKNLGQHFLTDRRFIDLIVLAVDPRPGDRLVEIGPGQGAITFPLLKRHGELTVIEFDRDLITPLSEAAHGLGFGRVGRHARGIERGGGTIVVAQPHREHRLVTLVPRTQAQGAGERLRRICGGGESGRHVDHQQRVVFVVSQQRFDGGGIALAIGVHHHPRPVVG